MNASALTELTTKFGPMIMARQFTEGVWTLARAAGGARALYDHDEPTEYLRILGGKCL